MTFQQEVELCKRDTSDAVDYIQVCRPECIKFVMTDGDFKSICLYVKTGSFDTMIFRYGYMFTLALLEYFTAIEFYEKCGEIVECIDRLNAAFKDLNIPKRL